MQRSFRSGTSPHDSCLWTPCTSSGHSSTRWVTTSRTQRVYNDAGQLGWSRWHTCSCVAPEAHGTACSSTVSGSLSLAKANKRSDEDLTAPGRSASTTSIEHSSVHGSPAARRADDHQDIRNHHAARTSPTMFPTVMISRICSVKTRFSLF